MLIALVVTSLITTISGVWAFIIECGAGLGLVMILRWYWWRINAWSEIVATIAPFIAYGLAKFVLVKFDPVWGMGIGENPTSFFFTVAFTTVSWLIATYITQPTDHAKLQSFFDKIKPGGNWKPFSHTMHGRELSLLGVCWISAIVMAYAALFLSGSILFGDWDKVLIYAPVTVVAFVVLRMTSKKVDIF